LDGREACVQEQNKFRKLGCSECAEGCALDFDFTMAFQPIVDIRNGTIFSHEALVRGHGDLPAGAVFERVNDENRYQFDQTCRVKAIELASKLGIGCYLNINFLPTAVYRPELCIRTTLDAAQRFGFPRERIIFEFTEVDRVEDPEHLLSIVNYYRHLGFMTAIDDFGAGYSGLNMLADTPTDIIKLDMNLIRDIDTDPTRQAIVRGVVQICQELGIRIIAEGVETRDELLALEQQGIELIQGFYFARPAYEALAEIPAQLLPPR
jgi:EAL domain-containing protein (putative c-di-GMP-specific phosphodiesterase class I)